MSYFTDKNTVFFECTVVFSAWYNFYYGSTRSYHLTIFNDKHVSKLQLPLYMYFLTNKKFRSLSSRSATSITSRLQFLIPLLANFSTENHMSQENINFFIQVILHQRKITFLLPHYCVHNAWIPPNDVIIDQKKTEKNKRKEQKLMLM